MTIQIALIGGYIKRTHGLSYIYKKKIIAQHVESFFAQNLPKLEEFMTKIHFEGLKRDRWSVTMVTLT